MDEDAILDLVAGRLHLDAAAEAHLDRCPVCARLLGAADASLRVGPRTQLDPSSATTVSSSQALTELDAFTPSRTPSGRARPAFDPGALLNGTYEIVRLLGRGGMGEVYEVSNVRLAGRYAIKVLRSEISGDDELLSRFRREATITSALRHPNIIQVFDFDRTDDGCLYLAMEFLEGEDLARLLAREKQLPLDRALRLVTQMASALAAAHRMGVVHRDLKPANVFIVRDEDDPGGRVKLMDFGLSKWRSPAQTTSVSLSRDQALIGTPRYMAPEQAAGRNREVGPPADQFALAAIVYEMLAGAPAFAAETVPALLYTIVHESPKPLSFHRPDLPSGLSETIAKALSKIPAARFPSIQNFHTALVSAAGESVGSRGRWRQRRVWMSGGVLALAGVVFGGMHLGPDGRSPVSTVSIDVERRDEPRAPAKPADTAPAPMVTEPAGVSGNEGRPSSARPQPPPPRRKRKPALAPVAPASVRDQASATPDGGAAGELVPIPEL